MAFDFDALIALFRSKKLVYRKPVLLRVGADGAMFAGHFDMPHNDPRSVSTGLAIVWPEIKTALANHAANNTPFPYGIQGKEYSAAYTHLNSLLASHAAGDMNINRLPMWLGSALKGQWEDPDDFVAGPTDRALAKTAAAAVQPQSGAEEGVTPESDEESEIVKITVVDNGKPCERLAVRLEMPWSKDLLKFARETGGVCLPEELDFLITHAKNLEAVHEKLEISSEGLIAIRGNLAMTESAVAMGKKKMSKFESTGIFRVLSAKKETAKP